MPKITSLILSKSLNLTNLQTITRSQNMLNNLPGYTLQDLAKEKLQGKQPRLTKKQQRKIKQFKGFVHIIKTVLGCIY